MPTSSEDAPLIQGRAAGARLSSPDADPTAMRRTMSMVSRARERLPSTHSNRPGLDTVLKDLETDERRTTISKLFGFAGIVFHIIGGAVTLHLLEGWSFVDCIYFCIVTTTTVGYGDIIPSSEWSRLFVVSYIVASIALTSSLLTYMVGMLLDQQEELILAALFGEEETPQPNLEDSLESSHHSSLTQRILRLTAGLEISDYFALGVSIVWLIAILAVGIAVFVVLENLSFINALYATIASASTVGFGDFQPTQTSTKLIMTVWLLFATVAVVKAIAHFTDASVKIKQRSGARRLLTAKIDMQSIVAMDTNCDGSIDKLEFLTELLVRSGKVARADIDAILARFQQLDRDGSGTIDMDEVGDV